MDGPYEFAMRGLAVQFEAAALRHADLYAVAAESAPDDLHFDTERPVLPLFLERRGGDGLPCWKRSYPGEGKTIHFWLFGSPVSLCAFDALGHQAMRLIQVADSDAQDFETLPIDMIKSGLDSWPATLLDMLQTFEARHLIFKRNLGSGRINYWVLANLHLASAAAIRTEMLELVDATVEELAAFMEESARGKYVEALVERGLIYARRGVGRQTRIRFLDADRHAAFLAYQEEARSKRS